MAINMMPQSGREKGHTSRFYFIFSTLIKLTTTGAPIFYFILFFEGRGGPTGGAVF